MLFYVVRAHLLKGLARARGAFFPKYRKTGGAEERLFKFSINFSVVGAVADGFWRMKRRKNCWVNIAVRFICIRPLDVVKIIRARYCE